MTTKPEQPINMTTSTTPSPSPTLHLFVRCDNRMIFPVRHGTYEAIGVSQFDAFCFSDPLTAAEFVEYIEYSDWVKLRNDIEHATKHASDSSNC